MMNKAINHVVLATIDSLTKFKNKFSYYFAIFAMVFGSTFGTFNAANAGDVTNNGAAITTSHVSTLVDAADGTLTVNKTKTATLDISVGKHGDGGTAIELSQDGASAAAVLDINTTAAIGNIVIDANIRTKAAATAGTLSIDSTSSTAAPQLVTINGHVGLAANGSANAANVVDVITVGTDGGTGGNVDFTNAVTAGTITLAAGDANEIAQAKFGGALIGAVTMNDNADAATKVIFDGSTRSIAGTITAASAGEGTVQITGTGITLNGALGATALKHLDIDATTLIENNGAVNFQTADVATGQVLDIDDDATLTALTLTGTGKFRTSIDGSAATSAITSVINGASDGDGTVENINTSLTTFTGNIGSTTGIGSFVVTKSAKILGELDAQTVTVATGQTLTIDDDFTGDVTTLTTTAIIDFITDGSAVATTVTGTIDGADDEGGVLKVSNTNVTTFAGLIGQNKSIKTLDLDQSAVFNLNVNITGRII